MCWRILLRDVLCLILKRSSGQCFSQSDVGGVGGNVVDTEWTRHCKSSAPCIHTHHRFTPPQHQPPQPHSPHLAETWGEVRLRALRKFVSRYPRLWVCCLQLRLRCWGLVVFIADWFVYFVVIGVDFQVVSLALIFIDDGSGNAGLRWRTSYCAGETEVGTILSKWQMFVWCGRMVLNSI